MCPAHNEVSDIHTPILPGMVFEVVFPTVPVRVAQLQIIWIQEVRTMHFVLVELYNRKRGEKKSRVREKETGENLLVT